MEALAAIVALDSGDLLGGEVHVAAADAALPVPLAATAHAPFEDPAEAALPADRLVALARLSIQRIRGEVDPDAIVEVTDKPHAHPTAARPATCVTSSSSNG